MTEEQEQADLKLQIQSIGLNNGDSFVLGEIVRMWGVVGTVKNISKMDDGTYTVELWCPLDADAQKKYKITLVQIFKDSVMWVAAGHLYTNGDGTIYESSKDDISSEEE